jgi:hypothetical protein
MKRKDDILRLLDEAKNNIVITDQLTMENKINKTSFHERMLVIHKKVAQAEKLLKME